MHLKTFRGAVPKRERSRFTKDEIDRLLEKMTINGMVTMRYTCHNYRLVAVCDRRVRPFGMGCHYRTYPSNETLKAWLVTR